ncbi:MAG TPA: NAD(P)H-dependent glycerol-3-phosphate dehydrogenase [Flavitalea sp.]|nr:NAD(P)H-dependent glycerol-3-phosphate dehydrogenase [Flavitalea sp.]
MLFGIIGSGSWATALAKILTDNRQSIIWWIRHEQVIKHLTTRKHNPNYLSSVYFDTSYLTLCNEVHQVIEKADTILFAVPSAYIPAILEHLPRGIFKDKKILSAVKGILPDRNLLLNEYLQKEFEISDQEYFTVMGPCHAEEVASEKLSYLTFSGKEMRTTDQISAYFKTEYLNAITNDDVYGVQYAAVLKNIYALGAGIAHGLEYGDNFLSVLIANSADEMAGFLKKVGIRHMDVGSHDEEDPVTHKKSPNYAASVYLGDLLVTCYSLYSRNRMFGNMIGKGYSVKSAQLEMNMVAEGFNASKCIYEINRKVGAEMPIAETIYRILWEQIGAQVAFKKMEADLV